MKRRFQPGVSPCERRDLCSFIVPSVPGTPAPMPATLVSQTNPWASLLEVHSYLLTIPLKAPSPPGGTVLPSPMTPISGH
jgi:hypothetical protein